MMAPGFAMTPTPGGDEAGRGLIFFGGLLLIPGWPLNLLPLIAAGVYLRRRRVRRDDDRSEIGYADERT
jgi:hypothetical protein